MKSLFSKIKGLKTKKKSPLDVSDFLKYRPSAPTREEIMSVVKVRFPLETDAPPGAAVNTSVYGSPQTPEENEVSRRHMYFDLRHRCGAQGRCLFGECPCLFPTCFHMRPVIKGAEVFHERLTFEIHGGVTEEEKTEYSNIIECCSEDQLEDAVAELSSLIEKKFAACEPIIHRYVAYQAAKEAHEKMLRLHHQEREPLQNGRGAAVGSSDAKVAAQNDRKAMSSEDKTEPSQPPPPLEVSKIDELCAIHFWLSALLVNLGRDKEAVDSILYLCSKLPKEYCAFPLAYAAGWACLNDMEIRFFQSQIQQYPDFEPQANGKHKKPFLLRRVIDACGGELFYLDHVVHSVFSKEITAILSRARSSQYNDDPTEDPMGTDCVAESIRYYRLNIGGQFWELFETLALMPPLPDPTEIDDSERMTREGSNTFLPMDATPSNVLDGIGRSMLLHHMAKSYEPGSQDTAAPAEAGTNRERDRCIMRMKDLLAIVKTHEIRQQLADAVPKTKIIERRLGDTPMERPYAGGK